MAIDPARVKALFQSAIERADPADRRAFLEAQAGGDTELLGRLAALLAAFDGPANALDRPMAADLDATAAVEATASQHGEANAPVVGSIVAGRYKVRQEIGEGGMGSVYLAEQTHPVRRQVALKLIKPGMDSRTILARFESERQALALMDHPNIAKVLDAGATEHGRPYFVMELVKGIPLTEYCDAHRLDLPARLALFRQICSAVQHAHQKGIIHRDLKPTNILVESHDDKPVPKVIDFGLAKATSGVPLADQSLFTAFGSVTGTPLYMAPEQASFNALDIDTRADIYALGVILYEMLTGSTPIRRDTMKRAALDEMLRLVREDEPPTPSSRISTSEALASIASTRHIDPSRLSRFLKGDLDWIVMKALAKERSRRYDSAIGLANDLERFANHEPVSAGPPTAGYRMRKFVRRNRGQVVAAALVLVALVLGMMGTTLGLIEARRQERRALVAAIAADKAREAESIQTQEKEKARKEEATQRQRAEKRLAQVGKMNEILGSIFQDLDPKKAEKDGKPLSALLGERLDRAVAEIEGEAIGDPLVVARMQMTLGESQLGLGYAEKAIGLFTKARATFTARFGPDHPNTLWSMLNLARSYSDAGQSDRALKLSEETLALARTKLGPDDPYTLMSVNNLATSYAAAGQLDQATKLREETLALRRTKLGPNHPDTLASMSNLANSYAATGQWDRALKLREETLALQRSKLGPDHPDTLASMSNLANSYAAAGQSDRALKLREETLALRRTKLGPDHPDTLASMSNLANSYADTGQSDRALKLREETLALQRTKLGPDHPDTLASMSNLANSYRATGQLDRATKLDEEMLGLRRAKLGPDHPNTLTSMNNLATSYAAAGQWDRATKLREETLALQRSKLGPDHPGTLLSMNNLANSYAAAGQWDRAIKLREEALALARMKLGPDHPQTLKILADLARSLQDSGQFDRAEPLCDEALAARRKAFGDDATETLAARLDRANLDGARERYDVAEPALRALLADCRAKLGPDHANTIRAGLELAWVLEASGHPAEALPIYRTALDAARKNPANLWLVDWTSAELGRALLSTKAWAEAETAIRESLAFREARLPNVWWTFDARSLLGAALLGQGKPAEAEPLLRSGYEGLSKHAASIDFANRSRLPAALDRLIALGEATGKAEEVAAWKAEREKLAAGTAPKPEAGSK